MYEHLRNTFLSSLESHYNVNDVNRITNLLDKVVLDYDISEKITALAVIDDDYLKIPKLYLASKHLEGLSDLTINFYANRLKIFFESLKKNTKEITPNDIRMFLVQHQIRANVSDRTLDKFRQILNSYFEWCKNEEYISKNPCKNIHEIKYETKPRHALTRLQLEQVRRACKTKRDLAIVDVLYSTGCRVTELVNMKFSDINNNEVSIVGKGKKHNIVYLNTNAQLSLNDYLAERKGDSPYIFVSTRKPYSKLEVRSVQHIFSTIGKQLNIELSPHIIRHTSATLALQNGMPIEQVQKMLGHSSVATTQIYAETLQADMALSHQRYVV